eukprot:Nk52_evm110s224 gene=Nk52_evmTU110s224
MKRQSLRKTSLATSPALLVEDVSDPIARRMSGITPTTVSPWLICEQVRPDAHVRLFCFPWAGGAASSFTGWSQVLSSDVEVLCVQLPGRGSRIKEELISDMNELSNQLCQMLLPYMDKPFYVFGHSAGALIGFDFVKELTMRGLPTPVRLMVSGCSPPHLQSEKLPDGWLTDDSIMVSLLREWGGTPESILKDPNALEMVLPLLRADLQLINSYFHEMPEGAKCPVNVPLAVYGGKEDENAEPETLKLWSQLSSCESDIHVYEGGHFYFLDLPDMKVELLADINHYCWQGTKDLLKAGEEKLEKINSKTMSYPDDKCLHELFQEQVRRTPNNIALVDGETSLTYAEVDELTDLLANYLYSVGCRPNSIVGIYMERCYEYVLCYIAAHKAGGGYMPLEVVYPIDLVEKVLKEARPVSILTKEPFHSRLPSWQEHLVLNGDWLARLKERNIPLMPESRQRPTPDDIAYVVMSSGTTGVPKGIVCPHRGAVHSYYWRFENYPFSEGDRIACNVFFVWEVFRPLCKGYPSYIISDDTIFDAAALVSYIEDNGITRILFTPSLCQLVVDSLKNEEVVEKLKSLRVVWLCGEVVTTELRKKFIQLLPWCQLLNLYSISECHDVSVADLRAIDETLSPKYAPCGEIMENVRVYILDDSLSQVPFGVPGEVYVGGPTLAIGYLNREDLTSQRFIKNPFSKKAGDRLYRCGDRGRFLPNGMLEVIGRCDFMVKIRGYSVVLGAVEVAIAEHPDISSTVVVTEGDEGTDKRLVAYVVPEVWGKVPSHNSIRVFLKDKIPHYAIPSVFVLLGSIPINPASGKVDRKKLPISTGSVDKLPTRKKSTSVSSEDQFNTEVEKKLLHIWADLLKLDISSFSVMKSDSFFDVGGHSLLGTRLAGSIRDVFGVEITLSDVMRDPEFESMTKKIEDLRSGKGTESVKLRNELVGNLLREDAADLDPSIYPAATRKSGFSRYRVAEASRPPQRILLTGATGYLGSFLLKELLDETNAIVYCIVRAKNQNEAFDRIQNALESALLWEEVEAVDGASRIVPICGDLSKPLLGLAENEFKSLAGEIDAILHNGAQVNLVKDYKSLKAANTLGTMEVLRLAVTNGVFDFGSTRARPVHYISTNGVFPSNCSECKENDKVDCPELLEDGYAQSKWVAEKLCIEARTRGLPITIFRPGNMAGCSVTGAWNDHDFVYLLIAGCVLMEAVPIDVTWKFDLTPVDFAARAIVYLCGLHPIKCLGQVMHVQNPASHVPAKDVFTWMDELGYRIEKISYDSWKGKLASEVSLEEDLNGILHQLEVGLESFEAYLKHPPHFDCANFKGALANADLECPKVNKRLIKTYLQRLCSSGLASQK